MTEIAISKVRRRMIQKADKYVRKKEYTCMIPGCGRKAVKCHAIPRASLVAALAENGSLYTLNQSLTTLFQHLTPSHPLEIVKVGVNQASVFKGLCSSHDCTVFAPVERPEESEKEEIFKPLHLRSLLLEHSRKRKSFDFFDKLDNLIRDEGINSPFDRALSDYKLGVNIVELALFGFVEEVPELGSGSIDYYYMIFKKI